MPALGFSIGLSNLVGQSLGRNRTDQAIDATRRTVHILVGYIVILDVVLMLFPHWIMALFLDADLLAAKGHGMLAQGVVLIRIMSVYLIFDGLYMVYIGLLKGAGDTRFIMYSVGIVSLLFMVIPLYFAVHYFEAGLNVCWWILTIYVISLFSVAYFRYRQGHWKSIRVIEPTS